MSCVQVIFAFLKVTSISKSLIGGTLYEHFTYSTKSTLESLLQVLCARENTDKIEKEVEMIFSSLVNLVGNCE